MSNADVDASTLVAYLYQNGAALWDEVATKAELVQVVYLINQKVLRTIETPAGIAIVLGPRGRKKFKKDPSYIPEPNSVASEIVRRKVISELQIQGWKFIGYEGDKTGMAKLIKGQHTVLVYCRWNEPSRMTVKQLAKGTSRRVELLVVVRDSKSFLSIQKKYQNLHLLELITILPPLS